MKLLVLSFSRIESDPRVRRQIELFRDDWEIVTCGYGPKPEGSSEHFEVPEELAVWRYPRAAMIARQYRRAYWGNRALAWARDHLAGHRFDVILANEVESAGVAAGLAPTKGFHVDLHEYAPTLHTEKLTFRLFVAPFLRWQLRKFVSKAASTTTVGRAIADRYRLEFAFDTKLVMNAPAYSERAPHPTTSPIRVVHAGAALRNRGLGTLIEAMERTSADVTLDLYLPPNDPAYLEELRAAAARVPGVRMHDPVPFDSLIDTLAGYDVGIHILAPTNYNNAYAMPNKFFEYVQARLGLVIGPSPEMAATLTRHGLGVVSDDFSADAVARALDALTPERVDGFKAAAADAARELSAEAQMPVWKSAIDTIASR
ncbi:glycosyltransferase family 1 protein [Microbacterium sp. NPDC055988]|uniref:glycosyltransferase family 1 protein n=1 Tax=Microbacterium sp. NPDC055988 TaxID=3345671 RepID=UPI0035E07159